MAIAGVGTIISDLHPEQIRQRLAEEQENDRNAQRDADFARSEAARGDDNYMTFFRTRVEAMLHKLKTEERKLVNSHEQDALAKFREGCVALATAMGWQL